MSVNIKLIIEGKTINVLQSKYDFKQGADENGHPCEKTRFLGLELLVESSKDTDFFDWSIQSNLTKQLELHYVPRIMGGKTRKMWFVDCHCLELETHFNANSDKPMTERLFISAAGVKTSYSTEEYSAYWRKTYEDQGEETVREEELEPNLLGYHIEDLKNNIISENKIKKNQEVFLIIKSENASGQITDIDLTNKSIDYEYNGEWMKDDIISGIVLSDETTRVKLKAVKPKKR